MRKRWAYLLYNRRLIGVGTPAAISILHFSSISVSEFNGFHQNHCYLSLERGGGGCPSVIWTKGRRNRMSSESALGAPLSSPEFIFEKFEARTVIGESPHQNMIGPVDAIRWLESRKIQNKKINRQSVSFVGNSQVVTNYRHHPPKTESNEFSSLVSVQFLIECKYCMMGRFNRTHTLHTVMWIDRLQRAARAEISKCKYPITTEKKYR